MVESGAASREDAPVVDANALDDGDLHAVGDSLTHGAGEAVMSQVIYAVDPAVDDLRLAAIYVAHDTHQGGPDGLYI